MNLVRALTLISVSIAALAVPGAGQVFAQGSAQVSAQASAAPLQSPSGSPPQTTGGIRQRPAAPNQVVFAGSAFAARNSQQRESLSLPILSEQQMSEADRELEASAESSIFERARLQGFSSQPAGWEYQQIVCSSFPNRLLLRFYRHEGTGDASFFSAAIPRGAGSVQIFPILHRGYSLFSPAPVNRITVAAFNRMAMQDSMASEDASATKRSWVDTGLCYAALAGGDPAAPASALQWDHPGSLTFPVTLLPALTIRKDGSSSLRFVTATPRGREWELTFDAHGKLLAAATDAPALATAKAVAPTQIDPPGRPIPSNIMLSNATAAH